MTDQEIDDLIDFARLVLGEAVKGLTVSSIDIQKKAEELCLLKVLPKELQNDGCYYKPAHFLKEE